MRVWKSALVAAMLALPAVLSAFVIVYADNGGSGSIISRQPDNWCHDTFFRIGTGLTNLTGPGSTTSGEAYGLLHFKPLIPPDFWNPMHVTNIYARGLSSWGQRRDENYVAGGAIDGRWSFYLLYRDCLPPSRTDWGVGWPNWTQYKSSFPWQQPGCRGTNDRSHVPFLTLTFTNWGGSQNITNLCPPSGQIDNVAEFNRWADDPDIAYGIVVVPDTNYTAHFMGMQGSPAADSLTLVCQYTPWITPPPPYDPYALAVSNISTAASIRMRWLSGDLNWRWPPPAECTMHVWAATNEYPGTIDARDGLLHDCPAVFTPPTVPTTNGARMEAVVSNDPWFARRGSDVIRFLVNVVAREGQTNEMFGSCSYPATWVVPNPSDTERPGDIAVLHVTNGAGAGWFVFRWNQPSETCPPQYLDHCYTMIRFDRDPIPQTEAGWLATTNLARVYWKQSGEGSPLAYVYDGTRFESGVMYFFAARSYDQFGTDSENFTLGTPIVYVPPPRPDLDPPTVTPCNHLNGGTLAPGQPIRFRITEPLDEMGANITSLTLAVSVDGGAYDYFRSAFWEIGYTGTAFDCTVTYTPTTAFADGQIVNYTVVVRDRATPVNRAWAAFSVNITAPPAETTPPTITVISPSDEDVSVASNAPIRFSVSDADSGVDWRSLVLTVNGSDHGISSLVGPPSSATCTYTPAVPYAESPVTTVVVARDYAGNGVTNDWRFYLQGAPAPGMIAPSWIVRIDPVEEDGTVTVSDLPAGTTAVKIRTLLGVVVGTIEVGEGETSVEIDVSSDALATGLYVVEGTFESWETTYMALMLIARKP